MKPKSKIALHQLVTMLIKYIESSQDTKISSLIEPLSPSEIARLIESLPSKYRDFLATKVYHHIMGEVLLELQRCSTLINWQNAAKRVTALSIEPSNG